MTNSEESMSGLPDFLTVEEAARILRIGRTAAYEQTRRFEETNGEDGIPVIRIGRLMRVPRTALERWNGGPLTVTKADPEPKHVQRPSSRRRKPKLPQQSLPLDG